MLSRLLDSLLGMERPAGVNVAVHVVENDTEPASAALVAEFDARAPFPMTYELETRIGIPQARNCLLRFAYAEGATALVFVDDDEEVEPGWLLALHHYAGQTEWKAVLQGRVMASVPSEQEHFLPYFQRKIRRTGQALASCASNNTLVPLTLLPDQQQITFDESRPRDGGTDTIFFSALANRGVPLLYCHEAVVVETIPAERANIGYLSRRKYRVGLLTGSGILENKPRSLARALFYALRSVFSLVETLFFALLLQRDRMIRAWLRGCRSLGCAAGYFRLRHEPYQDVQGF